LVSWAFPVFLEQALFLRSLWRSGADLVFDITLVTNHRYHSYRNPLSPFLYPKINRESYFNNKFNLKINEKYSRPPNTLKSLKRSNRDNSSAKFDNCKNTSGPKNIKRNRSYANVVFIIV
jgi:hypothetical protein